MEVVTNALEREPNPNSTQRETIDVFSEQLGPILKVKEQMREVRSIAQIIDTSLVKMTGRSMEYEKYIGTTLDMLGEYKVCDELSHEGRRVTTIQSMSSMFS